MESKKIISALAMAAVLVGCSQEEIVTQNNNLVASGNLEERPVIGNVELGGLGVESRMAISDNHGFNVKYETGDKVGAAIIDEPELDESLEGIAEGYTAYSWSYSEYLANKKYDTDDEPVYYTTAGLTSKDFYNTVEYISTNYPYTRAESGAFETQANLVEGNYMFYMPYNAGHLNRTRINAVLPQVQDCSDDVMKDATYGTGKVTSSSTVIDKFYKGTAEGAEYAPVLVGYKFLEAPRDGSIIKPSVSMTHLYAYPMITIKNDFNGWIFNDDWSTAKNKATQTMTIDSIHIYHNVTEANLLFYKSPIKSSLIASVLEKDGEWDDARLTTGAPTADILDTDAAVLFEQGMTYAPKNRVAETSLTNNANRVTCVIGEELQNGESYSFRAILPAGNYGHDLMARVYVTIGDKQFIVAPAMRITVDIDGDAGSDTREKVVSVNDFTFVDNINGGEDCELVRGQQYPKAEIREDGSALKAFAGTMMTISMADACAFELKEAPIVPEDNDYGLKNNTEFVNYLVDYVQRGVKINEYASLRTVAKAAWKTTDPDAEGDATAGAGNLAFAEENTIIINAQLIKDLKLQTIVTGNEEAQLVLNNAVLPIADDVKIKAISGTVYTFTTLDETVSYNIDMKAEFNTVGDALVDGINNISGTVTLAADEEAEVANAVVMLATGATATYDAETTGVNAIYVANGATLKINAACDAMIIAEEGAKIIIGANGSLTNENNLFTGTEISNNSENVVAGTLDETTKVTAVYANSWPTTAIAADSRINNITINTAVATGETTPLAIEQAQIDIFKDLTNVTLTLGANVKDIYSVADVELTNLVSLTATSATWRTTSNTEIVVSAYQWGEEETDVTTVNGVTAGTNVTLPGNAEHWLVAAIAAGNNVTLQSNVTLANTLTIPADYNGTIDLNGKTLEGNIVNKGTLVLKDGNVYAVSGTAIANDGVATLNRVNATSEDTYAVTNIDSDVTGYSNNGTELANMVEPTVVMTINGGVFTSNGYKDGDPNHYSIKCQDNAVLNVNDAEIGGKDGGLYVNWAYANLVNTVVDAENKDTSHDMRVYGGAIVTYDGASTIGSSVRYQTALDSEGGANWGYTTVNNVKYDSDSKPLSWNEQSENVLY